MHLMDEFARSFHSADHVYLLDIYAASEKPIEGVSSEALAERMTGFGHRSVNYVGQHRQGGRNGCGECRTKVMLY